MTTTAVAVGIGICAVVGTAAALWVQGVRHRRRYAHLDTTTLALHRRLQACDQDRATLREQISELAPALVDAQRRWGFDLSCWPEVEALVVDATRSSPSVSWWLLQHAPGIGRLSEGGYATECFLVSTNGRTPVAAGAWTPPRIEGNS